MAVPRRRKRGAPLFRDPLLDAPGHDDVKDLFAVLDGLIDLRRIGALHAAIDRGAQRLHDLAEEDVERFGDGRRLDNR